MPIMSPNTTPVINVQVPIPTPVQQQIPASQTSGQIAQQMPAQAAQVQQPIAQVPTQTEVPQSISNQPPHVTQPIKRKHDKGRTLIFPWSNH